MNRSDLTYLKDWFTGYCASFKAETPDDLRNFSLKKEHTFNVCENTSLISEAMELSLNEKLLAGAAALLHDTGRFPQYARYRTFRDSISVNHGKLGAEILQEQKILRHIPEHEQDTIISSVKFHNAFGVPPLSSPEKIFFLRLIRDADKLDVWRVFSEYYEQDEAERASAAGLGLPDLQEYPDEALQYIHNRQIVPLSKLKTLNDFKLLQLSWIFDLNFRISFKLLLERRYIDRISATLPQGEKVQKTVSFLQDYAYKKSVEPEAP